MNETRPPFPSTTNPVQQAGTSAANAAASAGPASAQAINRAASTAHQAVDRVAAAAAPAVEKLRASATSAAEAMKARADQFGAVEEQWIATARNYVREHPFATVAIGVLVGLLIGKASGYRGDRD